MEKFLAHFTERLVFFHFFFSPPTKFSLNVEHPSSTGRHSLTHTTTLLAKHENTMTIAVREQNLFNPRSSKSLPIWKDIFWKSLNAAVVWHTEHHLDLKQEEKDRHKQKPFYWMTHIPMIPPGLCGVFYTVVLHVQIHCLLATNVRLVHEHAVEQNQDSNAHSSASTVTLDVATALHLQTWKTIYSSFQDTAIQYCWFLAPVAMEKKNSNSSHFW